jgi:hypothetical protein
MANLVPHARVDLLPQDVETLLLVRYFAAVTDGRSYRVRVWGSGRVLSDHVIVLQESRLVRTLVPPACAELIFEVDAGDDIGVDLAWRIRVGVLQQFHVDAAAA